MTSRVFVVPESTPGLPVRPLESNEIRTTHTEDCVIVGRRGSRSLVEMIPTFDPLGDVERLLDGLRERPRRAWFNGQDLGRVVDVETADGLIVLVVELAPADAWFLGVPDGRIRIEIRPRTPAQSTEPA